jgi:outer membrane protein OmpA-like peptidoglycan-associated protein
MLAFIGFALFALRTYTEKVTAPPPPATDERLVWVGGKTILRNPEQLGQEMKQWFDNSQDKTLAFELSDLSFEAQSAELSPLGQGRVAQIAALMKSHPGVAANIENPIKAPTAQAQQLDRQRAQQWRDAIVSMGVDPSRLSIADESDAEPTARSSQLVVALTK